MVHSVAPNKVTLIEVEITVVPRPSFIFSLPPTLRQQIHNCQHYPFYPLTAFLVRPKTVCTISSLLDPAGDQGSRIPLGDSFRLARQPRVVWVSSCEKRASRAQRSYKSKVRRSHEEVTPGMPSISCHCCRVPGIDESRNLKTTNEVKQVNNHRISNLYAVHRVRRKSEGSSSSSLLRLAGAKLAEIFNAGSQLRYTKLPTARDFATINYR